MIDPHPPVATGASPASSPGRWRTALCGGCLTLALLAASLVGCQMAIQERGHIIDPAAVEKVEIGKSTKAEVKKLLGSPTVVNRLQGERWIYIQDRSFVEFRTLNKLELVFDAAGKVEDLRRNFGPQLNDPTALAGFGEDAPWWKQFTVSRPYEDDVVWSSVNGPWWNPWAGWPNGASTTSTEAGWWRTIIDRGGNVAPPEDTTFTASEAGWWQDIWSDDPTANRGAESPATPEESSPAPATDSSESGSWWNPFD